MGSFSLAPLDLEIETMTVNGCIPHIRMEELRRFMVSMLLLLAVAALCLIPEVSHAADSAWNGQFGPDATLTKNTNASLQGWWKTAAGWGLWISIGCLLFSIFFMGGKWWWIPVCVFLVCLFGEKTISQVATWAGFASVSGA